MIGLALTAASTALKWGAAYSNYQSQKVAAHAQDAYRRAMIALTTQSATRDQQAGKMALGEQGDQDLTATTADASAAKAQALGARSLTRVGAAAAGVGGATAQDLMSSFDQQEAARLGVIEANRQARASQRLREGSQLDAQFANRINGAYAIPGGVNPSKTAALLNGLSIGLGGANDFAEASQKGANQAQQGY